MAVGDRIRKIAKEKNISLKEIAQKIGMPYSTFHSFLQRNNNRIDIEIIEKIADALEVSSGKILFDPDETITIKFSDEEKKQFEADLFKKGINTYSFSIHDKREYTESEMAHGSDLLVNFFKLNEIGQKKALENIEDLTKIPEYQKKDDNED